MNEDDELVSVYTSDFLVNLIKLKEDGLIKDFSIEDGDLFVVPNQTINYFKINANGVEWFQDE